MEANSEIAVGLLNTQAITQRKSIAISDSIEARRLDVLVLTETWHHASGDLLLQRCAPPGYSIIDATRQEACASSTAVCGGGIAIVFSNRYTAKRITLDVKPTTFEVLCCSLRSASTAVVHIAIYRPGSANVTELFFQELTSLLEIVVTFRTQIVITGDFNVHVNDPSDKHAHKLAELLESFDLQQSISQPTQHHGNTLDLVITRPDNQPTSCKVDPPNMISDHSLIVCNFSSIPVAVRQVPSTTRPWKRVDRMAFSCALASALPTEPDELSNKSAEELFEQYDSTLRRLADQFAPERTTTRRIKRLSPWFDDDCRHSRRLSRLLERHYRRSKSDGDRAAWIKQVRSMHTLYLQKENLYWTSCIAANTGNPRKMWRSISSVLKKDKDPSAAFPLLTADQLSQFFVDKIETVRNATKDANAPSYPPCPPGLQFVSFREYSMDEVRRVLVNSPVKTCSLDPIPTDMLLESIDIVLPYICTMCNRSLSEGYLPAGQKEAIITPVVKKPNLDSDEPKNYRPISNLAFISKVIERIVSEQVRTYLTESNLMPPLQSAYRPGHSTETALLKIISDIIDAADEQKATLLSLLDMSAAFDTVDFQILLRRLETTYGIGGKVLGWFSSFLSDRKQIIAFAGKRSTPSRLVCGVPQGSVLGPLLFVLYAADVMKIAHDHGVNVHAYADDMQTYVSCQADDQQSAIDRLLACIADVSKWMSSNRLKLNADKTEFIWLGTNQQLAKITRQPLTVGGQVIAPVQLARNLGVILDDQLKMDAHARSIVRSCFYQLRQLRSVQRSLTIEARRALVTAFIASRVDYCNAVFYGVAKSTIHRLQICLSAAARLVTGVGKFNHITPVLRDTLHWLPVEQRITFKIATLAFDCVRGTCPAYFHGICNPLVKIDGRSNLRSAQRGDVHTPRTKLVLGTRSFRVAGPAVWNSLPPELHLPTINRRQFRDGLKTYLFKKAYARSPTL